MKKIDVDAITDVQVAEALGWTDIKSWGGRGMRGLRPGAERHESLPSFTFSLEDIGRALQSAELGWQVRCEIDHYEAGVWDHGRNNAGVWFHDERPARALCAAFLLHAQAPTAPQQEKPGEGKP